MNRDINASKNILLLLQLEKEGKKRPIGFMLQKTINECDTLNGDKYFVA